MQLNSVNINAIERPMNEKLAIQRNEFLSIFRRPICCKLIFYRFFCCFFFHFKNFYSFSTLLYGLQSHKIAHYYFMKIVDIRRTKKKKKLKYSAFYIRWNRGNCAVRDQRVISMPKECFLYKKLKNCESINFLFNAVVKWNIFFFFLIFYFHIFHIPRRQMKIMNEWRMKIARGLEHEKRAHNAQQNESINKRENMLKWWK